MLTRKVDIASLHHFLNQPIHASMVSYLAQAASEVVVCNPLREGLSEAYQSRCQGHIRESRALATLNLRLPPLDSFILHLSATPKITTPILMSTIIYLSRLKQRLQSCQGSPYTCHRIFLIVLILSVKYHDDTPYTNKTWAYLSHIVTRNYAFRLSCDDINLMERQVLLLLDWNLCISEDDLFAALMPILPRPVAASVILFPMRIEIVLPQNGLSAYAGHQAVHTSSTTCITMNAIPMPNRHTRYMAMSIRSNQIPTRYNVLAAICAWITLAGFIVLPNTFTSIEKSESLGRHYGGQALQETVRNVQLLPLAGVLCGIGLSGSCWLWWKWRKNYVWLIAHVFM
ncbi:PHO85 cyclin-1 [Verticillium dahliae]|nr:PHO85 cyclin-1 [Verticillium dahliae]